MINSFQWVALAVDVDASHRYRYVVVDQSHIIGTNGVHLHVGPNHGGLRPGFYAPHGGFFSGLVGNPVQLKWSRVLPDPHDMEQHHEIKQSVFDDYYCIGNDVFPAVQVDAATSIGNEAIYLFSKGVMFIAPGGCIAIIAKVHQSMNGANND